MRIFKYFRNFGHSLKRFLLKIYFYTYVLIKLKKIIQYFYKLHDTFLSLKWSNFNMDETIDIYSKFNLLGIYRPRTRVNNLYKFMVWQPPTFLGTKRKIVLESVNLAFGLSDSRNKKKNIASIL